MANHKLNRMDNSKYSISRDQPFRPGSEWRLRPIATNGLAPQRASDNTVTFMSEWHTRDFPPPGISAKPTRKARTNDHERTFSIPRSSRKSQRPPFSSPSFAYPSRNHDRSAVFAITCGGTSTGSELLSSRISIHPSEAPLPAGGWTALLPHHRRPHLPRPPQLVAYSSTTQSFLPQS
jgi:hypothetical protein